MDPLSEVLSVLRVSSALSSRFEGQGRWAFRFPAYQHVKFGGVLSGRFHLWLDGSTDVVALEEGDFYMLTTGQPFCSASDPSCEPIDGPSTYRAIRDVDGVVRFTGITGDVSAVSLASGRFVFENNISELLIRYLPPLIHLRATDQGTSSLTHLLALLKEETGRQMPGTEVARSSLAALVLVSALRAYLDNMSAPSGWLGALSDPRIGQVLTLIHGQPGERWTLNHLARTVHMSRTAFASHFRRLVGIPPMDYLNRWRMAVAQTALRHSDASLAEIAERVGYLSDVSFSIAFKRVTGQSPGHFRSGSRQ